MGYQASTNAPLQAALDRLMAAHMPLDQYLAARHSVDQLQIITARLLLEALDEGHTQTEIAAAAGVSQQAISRAEKRAEALLSGLRAHRRYVQRRGS